MQSEVLRNAIGYWEPRRVWYNAVLTALAGCWIVLTWPHFRPAFTFASLSKLIVLAVLANVCYSAAYLVDVPMQRSPLRAAWQQWRWVFWLFGTLFALAVTYYWVADEIYPFVGAV
jgi:hypothetical protein